MDAILSQYLTNIACILQACYERRRGIYCIASESRCIIIEKCWCPPLVFGIRFIISRPDKTPLAADISHRISTSQLKELVHSVICQQVLRLCQTQRHKRQPSQKQTQRQNSGWRRRGREGEPSPTGPSMAASRASCWRTRPLIGLRWPGPLRKLWLNDESVKETDILGVDSSFCAAWWRIDRIASTERWTPAAWGPAAIELSLRLWLSWSVKEPNPRMMNMCDRS